MAQEPRGVGRHEEVAVTIQFHELPARRVNPHPADSAHELGRGSPLLPCLLHKNPGRVDMPPRLGFPVQHQDRKASLRRPPRTGEAREAGADDDDVVAVGHGGAVPEGGRDRRMARRAMAKIVHAAARADIGRVADRRSLGYLPRNHAANDSPPTSHWTLSALRLHRENRLPGPRRHVQRTGRPGARQARRPPRPRSRAPGPLREHTGRRACGRRRRRAPGRGPNREQPRGRRDSHRGSAHPPHTAQDQQRDRACDPPLPAGSTGGGPPGCSCRVFPSPGARAVPRVPWSSPAAGGARGVH